MPKSKPVQDTRTQKQKFIDAAKEHGADADNDAFRRAVRKVALSPADKAKNPPETAKD